MPDGAGQSPPVTGAPGVPVCGPMYRRHGPCRPNFVPKFGASVIGLGPYERTGIRIFTSPAGPQLPISRDSGKVSKGRAEALPLVVSRRAWEGNRNPSRNFSWGSPLDRQRALARWPHRARRARHFPASRRGRGLPDSQRKPKPLFPAKTPGNRLTGVFACGII